MERRGGGMGEGDGKKSSMVIFNHTTKQQIEEYQVYQVHD